MTAWKLAYHATAGGLGGDAVGVTSITQLALPHLRRYGPRLRRHRCRWLCRVELFDGNLLDYSAAEMRKLLADNGLELVATFARRELHLRRHSAP